VRPDLATVEGERLLPLRRVSVDDGPVEADETAVDICLISSPVTGILAALAAATALNGGTMEDPPFRLLMTKTGSRKMDLIKALRDITRLSAWRSRQLLDQTPVTVLDHHPFEMVRSGARALEEAGAATELACLWCERRMQRADLPVERAGCVYGGRPMKCCPAARPEV
jgi:ribosomal protein L7/L12